MTIKSTTINTEELLRLLCHDLANPLQIMGMGMEVLSDNCPPEMEKIVARMKRSTDSMIQILALVRQLQAYSAGKKELKMEPVNVDAVIETNMSIFQEKLVRKNITLKYIKADPESSPAVLAEQVSLCNNIFKNIISNALKFSNENSTVEIFLRETTEHVIVKVSDNGIGIPKELLANLFLYNKETSRSGTMGERGTGFGMPLVKLFLDLYDVKVNVHSIALEDDSVNHGTTFELTFHKAS